MLVCGLGVDGSRVRVVVFGDRERDRERRGGELTD